MKQTKEQVISLLKEILAGFESGDTLEGRVSFMCDYDSGLPIWDADFAYRIGNLEGQGGWRMSV